VIIFPNCKINLGLHITGKRNDGYHDLETIFYPVPFCDGLEIIHNQDPHTAFTLSGLQLESSTEDNICYKAYSLLKKNHPTLPSLKLHLHKVIPAGAGLGGGSADGAFTLLLINQKFNLGLNELQLMEYALQLGSDCPFFIINKPVYATGRGEKMQPVKLDLSNYKIVLINPGIHINTGWAFSQITTAPRNVQLKHTIALPVAEWKNLLYNDFEIPVFQQYPLIKQIKELLYDQGAIYSSMTGSGSTVYGIFEKSATPQLNLPADYFMKTI
jgi:4-diphosphocytidyl-2-C-methyl-D-erythritol kinase